MVNRKLLFLAALLITGCASDPTDDGLDDSSKSSAASAKIINTSVDAQTGKLLVYFDDEAVATVEKYVETAAATRSAVTRSGIESVDEVLAQINATSIERLFPIDPRHEDRARAAGLHRWYTLSFDSEADLDAAAQKLAAAGAIERVQFNTKLQKMWDQRARPYHPGTVVTSNSTRAVGLPFNDPYLADQWQYRNTGDKAFAANARVGADVNAVPAWAVEVGNPNVIVAIVDEGVKYSHPDLAANMWTNTAEQNGATGVDDDNNGYKDDIHGFNFVTNGGISWNDPGRKGEGDSGHGTHVGGSVAAVNNNSVGVGGVAGGSGKNDGVRLMSCQIFSGENSNSGTTEVTAQAYQYAANNGASIVQCSFGYSSGAFRSDNAYKRANSAEIEALEYFLKTSNCDALDGGLAIFAAGNESGPMAGYPGGYSNYIAVTAFGPDLQPTWYTNYGPGCNIAAPGGELDLDYTNQDVSAILSTLPSELYSGDEYGYMQGTSMACPHVTGVAALGLSYALDLGKKFTHDQFVSMLLTSVNDVDIYCTGSKSTNGELLYLSKFKGNMGSGSIDAYRLLMQIEGTPCLVVGVDEDVKIPMDQYFGGSAVNLTYKSVDIAPMEIVKLGLTAMPEIKDGQLIIHCYNSGTAEISVTAIAGGTSAGTKDMMGGISVTKKFAIMARSVQSENGGWF